MWDSLPSQWANHLSAYPNSIKTRELSENKPDLASLDNFVWSDLNTQVNAASRTPPHITSAEYVSIIRWKLKRGRWRPRLQSMADALDDAQVVSASTKAFAALKKGNLRDALKALVELKGCGPATASAILSAADEQVPFMSDELLQEAMGERKYTMPAYMQLVQKVRQKVEQLSAADSNRSWTARDVERAVFAAHHGKEEPVDPADRPSYRSQAKAANAKKTSRTKPVTTGESGTKETAAEKKRVNSGASSGKASNKTRKENMRKLDRVEEDFSKETATGREQVNSRTRSGRAFKEVIIERKEKTTPARSNKTFPDANTEKQDDASRVSTREASKATAARKKEENPDKPSPRTRADRSKRVALQPEKPQARKRMRGSTKEEGESAKPSMSNRKVKKPAEANVGTPQRLTRANNDAAEPGAETLPMPRRSTRVKAPTGV